MKKDKLEMKRDELEIVIRGRANTGKTTLALFILRLLHQSGFDVKLIDDTKPGLLRKPLKLLRGVKLTIKTASVRKTS